MSYKDLVILNNEKVFEKNGNFYCDNLDLKVLPEGLNEHHKVTYLVRKSKKEKLQKINIKNIKRGSNIFKFIYLVIKTFKIEKCDYLIVCITPYTFLAYLFLRLFKKKVFVYLFSSGHEEYKHILGNWSVWIYDLMYKTLTSKSEVIVCHERLHPKEKSHLVYISRLDDEWLSNFKNPILDKVRFLYVGRMSPEKGIFKFIKMFKEIDFPSTLSIVGNSEKNKNKEKNINYFGYVSESKLLISIYDEHNITVLPSFTEATPYVVDESLSRKRPVIIFEDIDYIVREKVGIFVSKRDISSFSKTTKYIMDNYQEIQKKMEKNDLPTKKSMIKQISDIINSKS